MPAAVLYPHAQVHSTTCYSGMPAAFPTCPPDLHPCEDQPWSLCWAACLSTGAPRLSFVHRPHVLLQRGHEALLSIRLKAPRLGSNPGQGHVVCQRCWPRCLPQVRVMSSAKGSGHAVHPRSGSCCLPKVWATPSATGQGHTRSGSHHPPQVSGHIVQSRSGSRHPPLSAR